MKNVLSNFLGNLFRSKKKIFITIVLSFVFIFIFFPKGELRDFFVSKIPEWSGRNLYVEFSDWAISPPPSTGVRLDNFLVEIQKFPGVHIDQLTVEPALRSFFSKFPLGHIDAKGIFHGDLDFDSQSAAKRSETGLAMEEVNLDARNFSIQDLAQTFALGANYRGQINLKVNADIEPTFQDQPDGDIDLSTQKVETSDTTLHTMMGPLQLPGIKLGQVTLKGKLSGGRFQIERFQINGDEIQGTVKGGIAVQLQNKGNGGVQVLPGAYTFEIDLHLKQSLEAKAALFLTFLDQYKTPATDGSRYSFKISATSLQGPPAMSALR